MKAILNKKITVKIKRTMQGKKYFESKGRHTQNRSTSLLSENDITRSTTEPKEGSPTSGGAAHPRSESLQRVRRPSYLREGPQTQRNRKRGLRSIQACSRRNERRRNTQANSRREYRKMRSRIPRKEWQRVAHSVRKKPLRAQEGNHTNTNRESNDAACYKRNYRQTGNHDRRHLFSKDTGPKIQYGKDIKTISINMKNVRNLQERATAGIHGKHTTST